MKNPTLKKIRNVKTFDDLKNLNIGPIYCNIGYRGGGIGFYRNDISKLLSLSQNLLPKYIGAGCNYLGGGVLGSIFPSSYNESIPSAKAEFIDEICQACIRVYEYLECETLNGDDFDDWDNLATKSARNSGIVSAY